MSFMRQTHFLQQIQGGQQMESIENEIEPGYHIGQPRVSFTESTSTQNRNLLAFLNLLEIQIMNRHRRGVLSRITAGQAARGSSSRAGWVVTVDDDAISIRPPIGQ
jgi:hypothetical protein